jgi:hypothetical protein
MAMNFLLTIRDAVSRRKQQMHRSLARTEELAQRVRIRMNKRAVPDFLIVGAAKAGTTFLSRALNSHPDITLPENELNFFSENAHKGLDWYHSVFEKMETPLKGDKSTSYLLFTTIHPFMHRICPASRIIVCLRNPIDRAYSNWTMRQNMGLASLQMEKFNMRCIAGQGAIEGTDFESLFKAYLEKANIPRRKEFPLEIFERGLYAHQVSSLESTYPASRIKVVIQERMRMDKQEAYNEILDFLKMESHHIPSVKRPNKGNYAKVKPMKSALRKELVNFYADDVALLKKLLDDPLPEWKDFLD